MFIKTVFEVYALSRKMVRRRRGYALNRNKFLTITSIGAGALTLVLGFQNCSNQDGTKAGSAAYSSMAPIATGHDLPLLSSSGESSGGGSAVGSCPSGLRNVVAGINNGDFASAFAQCNATVAQYVQSGTVPRCVPSGGCSVDGNIPDAQHQSANKGLIGACITACGNQPSGFEQLLTATYQGALGRANAPADVDFWGQKLLESNLIFANVAMGIFNSGEGQARLMAMDERAFVYANYLTFLGRNPETAQVLQANIDDLKQLQAANGVANGRGMQAFQLSRSPEATNRIHAAGIWLPND